MQCLLEILHSSTLHKLTYLKVLFQVKPILEFMFFFQDIKFKISVGIKEDRSILFGGNYIIEKVLGLLYDAPYFIVKVFLTKKVCSIQFQAV